MFLNPTMSAALERIAERAADVRRAFTPGAMPQHDDVATAASASSFTLEPLSVAAPDGAYFATVGPNGKPSYTRDGSFRVVGGTLVDGNGRAVLGLRESSDVPGELCIDPVDAALGRAQNVRLEPDGSFVYSRGAIDPRSGARETQRVVVGRLALARFPVGTKFATGDGTSFTPPLGVVPHTGLAGDGTFASLRPMQRERSRVDLDRSLARLKEAYAAFDALQAAETAKERLGKTAMDLVK